MWSVSMCEYVYLCECVLVVLYQLVSVVEEKGL